VTALGTEQEIAILRPRPLALRLAALFFQLLNQDRNAIFQNRRVSCSRIAQLREVCGGGHSRWSLTGRIGQGATGNPFPDEVVIHEANPHSAPVIWWFAPGNGISYPPAPSVYGFASFDGSQRVGNDHVFAADDVHVWRPRVELILRRFSRSGRRFEHVNASLHG
jgi:hypothetical protein